MPSSRPRTLLRPGPWTLAATIQGGVAGSFSWYAWRKPELRHCEDTQKTHPGHMNQAFEAPALAWHWPSQNSPAIHGSPWPPWERCVTEKPKTRLLRRAVRAQNAASTKQCEHKTQLSMNRRWSQSKSQLHYFGKHCNSDLYLYNYIIIHIYILFTRA